MPTYSPIIPYLLLWQLVLPLLIVLVGLGWLWALVTGALFAFLYTKPLFWESNSYSRYGALAVVITSVLFAIVSLINGSDVSPLTTLIQTRAFPSTNLIPWGEYVSLVMWLFSMIAFTATSPYPLGIRMPVVVYTVFYFLVGSFVSSISPLCIVIASVVFSFLMWMNLALWKQQSLSNSFNNAISKSPNKVDKDDKINARELGNHTSFTMQGPPEPPFSLSLAIAINLVLVISLWKGISGIWWHTQIQKITPLIMISCVVIGVLLAKDWKKNILATSALVLILVSNVISSLGVYFHPSMLAALAFILGIAPAMFHTTAPVFRGMRITITLYVIYNAFCKPVIGSYLMGFQSKIPNFVSIVFIAFDALVLFSLFLMALHWKRIQKMG